MILLFSQGARSPTQVGAVDKQVLAARVRAAAARAGLRHSDLAERVGLSPPRSPGLSVASGTSEA
jgi:hypothetical protein